MQKFNVNKQQTQLHCNLTIVKMPPKCKKTRKKSEERFGGGPSKLPESDLPTNSDVAKFFYFVEAEESDFSTQVKIVANGLVDIWGKCNLQLPLKENKVLCSKISLFLEKVKKYNRKNLKTTLTKHLINTKDKLFDIAGCTCVLPSLPCDSRLVRCNATDCQAQHIICECPPHQRVPIEEREYLRDQRKKIGTKGTYQIGPVDRITVARQKARQKRKEKSSRRKHKQHMEQILVNPNMSFEVRLLIFAVLIIKYRYQ
jgi:hypothetical protein